MRQRDREATAASIARLTEAAGRSGAADAADPGDVSESNFCTL